MDDETITDVSSPDFEAWVRLVFDHPAKSRQEDQSWYWLEGRFKVSNPPSLLRHLTKLCANFPEVVSVYSLEQVDQGIWFLLCEPIRAGQYLADSSILLEDRLTCIRSMFHVYSDFVAKSKVAVMENCFDMWWDFVCGDFWVQAQPRQVTTDSRPKARSEGQSKPAFPRFSYAELSDQHKMLVDVMLETLDKILKLKEERCTAFALHGLGHLHHPVVARIIQRFINANKHSIPAKGLAWLEACRDGTVM